MVLHSWSICFWVSGQGIWLLFVIAKHTILSILLLDYLHGFEFAAVLLERLEAG
jgi:hypothetical protein